MADDLRLTVAGRSIGGWSEIRITRGIERCPSDFEISMTERFPGQVQDAVVTPGDPCVVQIGADPVVTGFVDTLQMAIGASAHTVSIAGRGRCQDLVDCAAEWEGCQISGASALEIAAKLAGAYEGLSVSILSETDAQGHGVGDVGPPIPQTNLILGETAWEIIERVCRFRGLLAYETADGNLRLARAGAMLAAGGLQEGVNVQSASLGYSVAQRFSDYQALLQSMDHLGDTGQGGNLVATVQDVQIRRNRKMMIIAEAGDSGADVCKQRALWEAARRAGRGYCLHVTTDSWRDAAGVLWEPNTLVPLTLPSLKLPAATWLLSEVSYRRAEGSGTTAELVLMPPQAFLPQPVVLNPTFQDVPPFDAEGAR